MLTIHSLSVAFLKLAIAQPLKEKLFYENANAELGLYLRGLSHSDDLKNVFQNLLLKITMYIYFPPFKLYTSLLSFTFVLQQ